MLAPSAASPAVSRSLHEAERPLDAAAAAPRIPPLGLEARLPWLEVGRTVGGAAIAVASIGAVARRRGLFRRSRRGLAKSLARVSALAAEEESAVAEKTEDSAVAEKTEDAAEERKEKVIFDEDGKMKLIFEDPEPVPVEADEIAENAVCIAAEGDTVIVRTGMGLFTNQEPGSYVIFSSGQMGILLAWKESLAIVHVPEGSVQLGENAKAAKWWLSTAAGSELCGRILNPKGEPIDGRPVPPVPLAQRKTFMVYKGMQERSTQYRPLYTGVLGVDFSVPVGRGQTMLFQGTDVQKDIHHLWPDLMGANAGPRSSGGPAVCICVCATLEAAETMRAELEKKGIWERCVLIVPDSEDHGAGMVAMNAAVAFAEEISDSSGEALVLMQFEPMSHIWRRLANAAGAEREAKGVEIDPGEETWVELEGTMLKESISERRKFWFALVSRAANSLDSGSVSLMGWLWEQEGGRDLRLQRSYDLKMQKISQIPRIADAVRAKMYDKIEKDAAADGITVSRESILPSIELSGDEFERIELSQGPVSVEPKADAPGVPNWEIEELKSITDGHILLMRPEQDDAWRWIVDPYKSLPRLGLDAMHPALLSMGASTLRLKMLQGRDRANLLHDTLGAPNMLESKSRLELRYVELILEQPAGDVMTVEQEVARLAIACSETCPALEGLGCTPDAMSKLAAELLASEAGKNAVKSIVESGEVPETERAQLVEAVKEYSA